MESKLACSLSRKILRHQRIIFTLVSCYNFPRVWT
uniref:Uncharacterized protein n=1 Tax=Arundo donax TaxID=35708 RepID=A0A0A8Y1X6_ARUDO